MLKRAFDLAGGALALALTWPLLLAAAVAIKLDSPGPVFFRQWRLGRDGVPFRIFKFRTMTNDAEQRGPAITVGGDRRITRVGRILRRLEIDELPTFLNVVRGHMSLVGPRPELLKYLPFYTPRQLAVFSVRPGITDPGTIRFRKEEGRELAQSEDPERTYVERVLPEKLELNLDYIAHRSFLGDLRLLTRTLWLIATDPR